MGALARLFGTEKRNAPAPRTIGDAISLGIPLAYSDHASDPAGLAVAERCRALISQSTASVPLPVYRRTDQGREEAEGHTLWRLLNDQASEWQSSFDLRESLARDCATYGNAYARIVRSGRGEPDELLYLPNRSVTVEILDTGRPRYRHTEANGNRQSILLREDTLHIRYASVEGILGVAPLQWARVSTDLAQAQSVLARAQADRGFAPDVIFSSKSAQFATGDQADKAFTNLKEQLRHALNRMRREISPLLLEAGYEAQVITPNSRDSQFLEARQESFMDICRSYGIPPSSVGLQRTTSYGSLSEEQRNLVSQCIAPWCKRIEAQLQSQLMSAESRRQFVIEHDLSGLLRGDLPARFAAFTQAVGGPWMTAKEARLWEGMNAEPDGELLAKEAPASNVVTMPPKASAA